MYDEGVFPLGIAMAYELLYSRNITGDSVVRYTDVPITDKSVMIEVLSLLSPFRRIAGYAYALRSDGIRDYERSGGVTLPFGKNRVTFADATLPYGLEFFPKFGVKSGIISVYIGGPGSPPPPGGAWKPVPAQDIEFRLADNPRRIEYRRPIGSSIIQTMGAGAFVGAASSGGSMIWKTSTTYYKADLSDLSNEMVDTESGFESFFYGEGIVPF